MMARGHIATSIAVLGVALSLVAGCAEGAGASASADGAAGRRFTDVHAMQTEYDDARAALQLPPGIVFPEDAQAGEADSFEEGVGASQAQLYWLFAWESEWLAQRGLDAQREQEAFTVLEDEVTASVLMSEYLDDVGRELYADYIQRAALGDPSGIQQDVTANPVELIRGGE